MSSSPLQRTWIERLAQSTADMSEQWLAYRTRWNLEFSAALEQAPALSQTEFSALLVPLILTPDIYRSETLQAQVELNQTRTLEVLPILATSLTEQQKRRSVRRLESLQGDLRAMMRQRGVELTPP